MKIKSLTVLIALMVVFIVGAITYVVVNNQPQQSEFYSFYLEYQKPSQLNYEEHTQLIKNITINVKYFVNSVENSTENIEIFNNEKTREENLNSYLIFQVLKTDIAEKIISLSFELETIVTYTDNTNHVYLTVKGINYNLSGGASEIYTLEFKNTPTSNVYSKVYLNVK